MNNFTQAFINSSLNIGALHLSNRLIQGPLAGFSCAPFRQLYYDFVPPAYCVSEMISAYDVVYKHTPHSRYLYRSPEEKRLCYQLSGTDPAIMAEAAFYLQSLGADLIDLNCGCPKAKIRKKGAGSALLENAFTLCSIVKAMKAAISIPLTVKLRIGETVSQDRNVAIAIEAAGADALIVHGRRWVDDYDIAVNLERIAAIKHAVTIPVIANGDITNEQTLQQAMEKSGCDAFMISRAGSGQPWLYQELLLGDRIVDYSEMRLTSFIKHLQGLVALEGEYRAVLQSKSLVRYYYRASRDSAWLADFYALTRLPEIERFLVTIIK